MVEVVRKDGGEYGTLEAAVSLAHDNFYSHTPPGSPYTDGEENIDGSIVMRNYDGAAHPTTFQEGARPWLPRLGRRVVPRRRRHRLLPRPDLRHRAHRR